MNCIGKAKEIKKKKFLGCIFIMKHFPGCKNYIYYEINLLVKSESLLENIRLIW